MTFNGNAYMGGRSTFGNQNQGIGNVSVADGSVMTVVGSAYMAGGGTLNLNASGTLNVGGGAYFGGNGNASTITLGASSRLNMTGSGQTLGLADGDYSALTFANTPTNGKVSVSASTRLEINGRDGNAAATIGAASSGIQFGELYLAHYQGDRAATSTLTVNNATATFTGSAAIGVPEVNQDNNVYNTGNAILNVTGTGVLNIGGGLAAGGLGNPPWTPVGATITLDPTAQINMTGVGQRLDLRNGTYGFTFSNTPGAGKFSVNASTNLELGNQVQNTLMTPVLNIGAGSTVQFNNLHMGWDDQSNSTNATLNIGATSSVTFNGAGNLGNQGNANISMASGSVLGFNSLNLGNTTSRTSKIQGTGQLNVTGSLINNGRIVADGGTLAVSAGSVDHNNVYGTMGDGTYAGWYAINGGKLTLPTVSITGATKNVGERSSLTSLDSNSLVNSVRLTAMTGNLNGTLAVSYLDPTNPGTYAGLNSPVSVWNFEPAGGLSVNAATLAFRYDTLLLPNTAGYGLFENAGSGWVALTGSFGGSLFTTNAGVGTINSTSQFALAQGITIYTSRTWAGGTSIDWDNAANWNTLPVSGDILNFGGANSPTNNNFTVGTAFSGLVFNGGASGFTMGGNSIVLGGNIVNSSSTNQVINLPIALAFAKSQVDTGANNITLGGILSNASGATPAGLTKLGNGTLTLGGTNTNTGVVNISAGTLSVATIGNGGVAGNLGQASSDAANLVLSGGTLQYTGVSASTDRLFTIPDGTVATIEITSGGSTLTMLGAPGVSTGGLVKSGSGNLTLTGKSYFSGDTTVNGGLLSIGNGGAGAGIRSCNIDLLASATVKFNHSDNIGIGSAIIGTGSFIKDGTGTLTLTGANTYDGSTTVTAGTLQAPKASALAGFAAQPISVIGTSTLAVNVGLPAPAQWSTAEMNDLLANPSLSFASGAFFGIDTSGGDFSITNPIASTVSNVRKLGANTLTLTGVNTYTGSTAINAGTLKIDGSGQLGGGTYAGAITNNGTFAYSSSAAQTLNGVISGTGALTKSGAGVLTLNAANTFSGTSAVSAGTINLGHNSALQNQTVSVATGATLTFAAGVTAPTVANLAGDGSVALATATSQAVTLTAGSAGVNSTFSGSLTGSGGLTKVGGGTMTLTANQSYSGATTISGGGTLKLQGGAILPSGLNAWFDASKITGATNGQNIASWTDLSGQNHDATRTQGQMNYATNQVNGLPVVQFRGAGIGTLAGNLFASQEYIVFNLPNGGDWGAALGSNNDNQGYLMNREGYMWDNRYPRSVSKNGIPLSPNYYFGNNNGFMILKVSNRNGNTSATSGWKLGGQEGWNNFDMNLAEVISFDHDLTDTEGNNIGGYLAAKYGIAASYTGNISYGSNLLPIATPVSISSGSILDLSSASQPAASSWTRRPQ